IVFTMVLKLEVYGLAWAAVIVSVVEVIILFVIMSRRIKGLFDTPFVNALARMASAAGFMSIVTYIVVSLLPLSAYDESFLATFPKFLVITIVSLGFYVVFSQLLKLEEVRPIIERVKKILFKRP